MLYDRVQIKPNVLATLYITIDAVKGSLNLRVNS